MLSFINGIGRSGFLKGTPVTPPTPSFAPTDISGLQLWLDATDSDTITESGGSVSQWDDKSGNANHAVQASGSLQPTYTGSAVDYDINETMTLSSNITLTDTTLFVVGQKEATTSFGHHAISRPAAGNDFSLRFDGYFTSDEPGFYVGGADGRWGSGNGVSAATDIILTARFEESTKRREGYTNGALILDDDGEATAIPTNHSVIHIGSTVEQGMQLKEVLIFNRRLSEAEMDQIGTYLADKHSISWLFKPENEVLGTGQSLVARLSSSFSGAGEDALETEGSIYFENFNLTNTAVSGTPMTVAAAAGDSWWNESTSGKGQLYIDEIDPVANKERFRSIIVAQGNRDGREDVSKAVYKAALQDFFAQLNTDFPNAKIYLSPIHRRTATITDVQMQRIREAHLETIDEISYVYYGADFYHQPLADDVHLTQTGFEGFGEDIARRIASVEQQRAGSGLGPTLSNMVLSGNTITFDITFHDDATDWSAPTEVSNLRFEIDGTPVTISSVSRTDASSGQINLASSPTPGSTQLFYTHWGAGASLNTTAPGILLDNSSEANLPLQQQILNVS